MNLLTRIVHIRINIIELVYLWYLDRKEKSRRSRSRERRRSRSRERDNDRGGRNDYEYDLKKFSEHRKKEKRHR